MNTSSRAGLGDISVVVVGALILVALAATTRSIAMAPVVALVAVVAVDRLLGLGVMRNADIAAAARPHVVSVGEPVSVVVTSGSLPWYCRMRVGVAPSALRPVTGGRVILDLPAGRVGVSTHVDVSILVSCFGIAPVTRGARVALQTPLHRGPRLDGDVVDTQSQGAGGLSATREYVPGDRPNRINWPATARTGTLLTRSVGSTDGELVVVVDTSAAHADELSWLSGPASLIADWWATTGAEVRLVTREITGAALASGDDDSVVVDEMVIDRQDLLARLARVRSGVIDVDGYPGSAVFAGPTRAERVGR